MSPKHDIANAFLLLDTPITTGPSSSLKNKYLCVSIVAKQLCIQHLKHPIHYFRPYIVSEELANDKFPFHKAEKEIKWRKKKTKHSEKKNKNVWQQ